MTGMDIFAGILGVIVLASVVWVMVIDSKGGKDE